MTSMRIGKRRIESSCCTKNISFVAVSNKTRKVVITFLLLLLLFLGADVHAQDKSVPEYLQISPKVISAGIEGYSTPLFNICRSENIVNAKVVYLPQYTNNVSIIYFYIKENNDSIVQKVKHIAEESSKIAAREKYARSTLCLTLKAYPEDIWTSNILLGDFIYSMVSISWDEQDEQEYLLVSFPLHASLSSKYDSRKNHSKKFRKMLQNGSVSGLELQFRDKTVEIPFGFPLSKTLSKMEEMYKGKK